MPNDAKPNGAKPNGTKPNGAKSNGAQATCALVADPTFGFRKCAVLECGVDAKCAIWYQAQLPSTTFDLRPRATEIEPRQPRFPVRIRTKFGSTSGFVTPVDLSSGGPVSSTQLSSH